MEANTFQRFMTLSVPVLAPVPETHNYVIVVTEGLTEAVHEVTFASLSVTVSIESKLTVDGVVIEGA
jgi:hypothetical protein